MDQHNRIDEKLMNEEYLKLFFEKYPQRVLMQETISEFIVNYLDSCKTVQDFINEFLPLDDDELEDETKFEVNRKTISRWVKKESYPNKTNLKKMDKNGLFGSEYNKIFNEQIKKLIRQEEEEFRFYYKEVELEEFTRQMVLNEIRESNSRSIELSGVTLYRDDYGNFYIREERTSNSSVKDRFEAKLFNRKIFDAGNEKAEKVTAKVKRAYKNMYDGGQSISSIDEFLNLYHSSSEISFLFIDLFKYLYEQEVVEGKGDSSYNEFENELQKKLDVLKNRLMSRKLKSNL